MRDEAHPVVHAPSRVPAHLEEATVRELHAQLEAGIIEPATGPTPWVARMVVVPKSDPSQVRITQDYRDINAASARERHPIPTFAEVSSNMAGAQYFTELDMNKAFHQICLDDTSRQYTVFSTPLGLMRCKRLAMGLASASEILQRTMDKVLAGLQGVRNIHDNIFICGNSEAEHDNRLRECLKRLRDFNITLNLAKCQFKKTSLTFMATKYSSQGVQAADKHISAVDAFQTPSNASDVRSFLGLCTFMRRYIPDMATVTEPLRRLTKKGQPWCWTSEEQAAFDAIKATISQDRVLAYFDRRKQTHLYVDASPVGLGAILAQSSSSDPADIQPVLFASRSLSNTEQRYSQTEREALAVKYGCLHFAHYLIGDPKFIIYTDHKPLLQLLAPGSRPPPRIERMALRIQHLTFDLRYRPGPENPADVFSRQPLPHPTQTNIGASEDTAYINALASSAVPNALTLQEVREASQKDPTIQVVLSSLQTGRWDQTSPTIKPFFTVRHELSSTDSLLLRQQRLVVPASLQQRTLQLAHAGHQGITRTKQRLQSKVWWPHMTEHAETLCRQCVPCQTNIPDAPLHPPAQPTEGASAPFEHLYVDLYGPLPGQQTLLVTVDQFSRFPIVNILTSTTTTAVTTALRRCFASFGLPIRLTSDNGPQFRSSEFRQFLEEYGVHHIKTPPLWPQANGTVERLNRTIGKVLRAAHQLGTSVHAALDDWLLAYRSTPHPATGYPPATLVFGRPIRDSLPSLPSQDATAPNFAEVQAREQSFRQKKCTSANQGQRTAAHHLKPGDKVLRKTEQPLHKLDSLWDPNPWTVTNTSRTTVTMSNPVTGQVITRHPSFVKPAIVITPPEPAEEQLLPMPEITTTPTDPAEGLQLPPIPSASTHPRNEVEQPGVAARCHPRAAKSGNIHYPK